MSSGLRIGVVLTLAAGIAWSAQAQRRLFELPPQPRPELYGNVLISRATAQGQTKSVGFSHWSHRLRYTCRVCHLELDFAFKRNATEITEEANRSGLYCGACHNGRTAFGHTEENCGRCHSGTNEIVIAAERAAMLGGLPAARYGNGIDWSAAIAGGRITPVATLAGKFDGLSLDTTLTLEAEWNFVPPAIFPHADHVRWLDCANCHPSIFNVKKKGTRHFSMAYNLRGEFCGACHLRVAFPLDDCVRCHPAMKNWPAQ